MPIEITMPQLSDTMTEGTVVKWKKSEGQAVKAGEEIADVETDKATMPMEAFDDGVLAAIMIGEGEKVQVGQALAVLAGKGEDAAAIKKQYAGGAASKPAMPAATAREGGNQVEAVAAAVAPAQMTTAIAPQPHSGATGRVVVSPLARRMAEGLGVDLAAVRGTGPGGRIVQKDVEQAANSAKSTSATKQAAAQAAKPAVVALPAPIQSGQKQVVPLTKMRATIAQRLQASKQNLPHFYETVDIDCTNALDTRARLNAVLEKEGIRLSLADFIAKSLAVALQHHATLNATFDGQQVTMHGDVNLGMAVALPGGLIVPVLRGVNHMGLKEIRVRTADLIERARQQKLKGEELSGGTFTISNLGNFGIRHFTAIINPPEVAILAIGAAEKRPVCAGDQIVARTMMAVTLSADHRVVDGAAAAEFLKTFRDLMEQPGMMLV